MFVCMFCFIFVYGIFLWLSLNALRWSCVSDQTWKSNYLLFCLPVLKLWGVLSNSIIYFIVNTWRLAAEALKLAFEVLYQERSWKSTFEGRELDLTVPESNALFLMN